LKGLEVSQATNKGWFGTSALAAGIADFGALDQDSLAKFMAISIHAWDSVVRDADCLGTLVLGVALFHLMFPMSYRWIWASAKEAADLGSRGRALLALVFGRRGGLLGLFVPKNIVHSHLCKAVCNIKMRICTKNLLKTHSVNPRGGIRAITPTHRVVNVDGTDNDLDFVILVLDNCLGPDNFSRTLFENVSTLG